MKKGIFWVGPCYMSLGYARHNREMIKAIAKTGVNIQVLPTDKAEGPYQKEIEPHLATEDKDYPIVIHCIPTGAWQEQGRYNILFTTVESKTLHPGLVRRASCFQEIWVPSLSNKQSFLKHGFNKHRVFVIPEGIDPTFWKCSDRVYSAPFTFMSHFDWSHRKGHWALLQAFWKAFAGSDHVRLLILTKKAGNFDDQAKIEIWSEANQFIKDVNGKLNNVEIVIADFSDKHIRAEYQDADCFVLPTLGEAWCLPATEAMACGLPCILPKIGGHRMFADNSTGWLTKGYWDYMTKYYHCDVDFYQGQLFFFPNIQHLARIMKHVVEHKIECKMKGQYASKQVRSDFTWEIAATIAVNRIKQIYKEKPQLAPIGHLL